MMKLRLLLLTVLLGAVSAIAYASNSGDKFTVAGITYTVKNPDALTVGISGTGTQTGDIELPGEVADSVGVKWKVISLEPGSVGSKVTSIVIPENITEIGINAFAYASNIKRVDIPSTVTNIASSFSGCKNLTEINVSSDNPNYSSINGVLCDKAKTTLLSYPVGRTETGYPVPDGIEKIAENAFTNADKLVTIHFPKSVKEVVGSAPFNGCKKLEAIDVADDNPYLYDIDGVLCTNDGVLQIFPYAKQVEEGTYTIPSSIKTIKTNAFVNNLNVKNVILSENVKTIQGDAFVNSVLETITITASVENISGNPFSGCNKLKAINVDSNNQHYSSDNGVLYTAPADTLITYPAGREGGYKVPEGTKYIGPSAFKSTKITDVSLPSSLVEICNSGFHSCSYLRNITFAEPSQLTKIGTYAFIYCAMETFKMPASVTEVGGSAFNTCLNLKNMKISENVTNLLGNTFAGCNALEEITIPASIQDIGHGCFQNCPNLTTVNFEKGSALKTMDTYVFRGCPKLQNINLEDTQLTYIGTRTFDSCTALEKLTLPKAIQTISANVFDACENLETVAFKEPSDIRTLGRNTFQNSGLQYITLPEGLQTIGQEAFNSCHNLKTVRIPASTTSVAYNSFFFCSNLSGIDVDKNNENYSSVDGYLLSKDKTELIIFPAGKANSNFTLLPPTLTRIGANAFYYCSKLENVTIPKKVREIGYRAFYLCPNLKHIAFLSDEPIAVENIGDEAFDDDILTRSGLKLYVRKDNLQAYEQAAFWKDFPVKKPSFIYGTEEYFPMSDVAVNLLRTSSENYTLVVPEAAWYLEDGVQYFYNVMLIGDYAFEGSSDAIKEVVVQGDIEYIGAQAFLNSSHSIENVFFIGTSPKPASSSLSTVRFDLTGEKAENGEPCNEFTESQHVYVKKSAMESYQQQWKPYKDIISADIPYVQGTEFGTFSREFAVDMSADNWNGRLGCPEVIAFTANLPEHQRVENGLLHLRMESINVGEGRGRDGVYIPANTGVLLKAVGGSTPDGFFYRIGEGDETGYGGSNVMNPVTEVGREVTATGPDTYFYVNGKSLVRFSSVAMPVHRAYLTVSGVPAGAKVAMSFSDAGTPATGITELPSAGDDAEKAVYYDLGGVRTTSPTRGIYVRNGRKEVLR